MNSVKKRQDSFLDTVEQTVADHEMIANGDHVLAAVSGGPDSVAMVLALLDLAQKLDFTVGIAHLNHMLRDEAAQMDEVFVRRLAHRLNLTFHHTRADIKAIAGRDKTSLEDAGRNARYSFFQKLCKRYGYTRVATGHTKDDNAELVLMNLLRGSGPKGLAGIPPVRENLFIRPLIRISKEGIIDFLDSRKQVYQVDASNLDPVFLRNRIRKDLIPFIQKEFNPAVIDSLNRLSRILSVEDEFMACEALSAYDTCQIQSTKTSVVFQISQLRKCHPAIQARVIRQAIHRVKGDLKRIQMVHLKDVLKICQPGGPEKCLDLPGRIRVYKSLDTLTVRKENLPLRTLGRRKKELLKKLPNERLSED